ncbi:MAG: c-type cytochrome [Burkholderiales bacterium]|jgi:cytochrome c553
MTQNLFPAIVLAAAFAAAPAMAADAAAAKKIVNDVCQACHGADGNSPSPDFPRLGGQHPDYLAKALRDYKSGARKSPIMAGFAATLSTDDIDNLAAYYGAQPAVVHDKF